MSGDATPGGVGARVIPVSCRDGLPDPGVAWRLGPIVARALLLGSALLLLLTGLTKALDPGAFERALEAHALLPAGVLHVVSIAFWASELLAACAAPWSLSISRGPRAPALAAACIAILFLAITIDAAALTARPPSEPGECGCGFRAGPVGDWAPSRSRTAHARSSWEWHRRS